MISLNTVISSLESLNLNNTDSTTSNQPVTNSYLSDYITLNVKIINSFSYNDLVTKSKEINNLFFKILPQYDYDRSAITCGGTLEKILDPDLLNSHTAKDQVDPVSHKKINATLLEAQFSIRLGVKLQQIERPSTSSNHEIYYVLDRSKKHLGVFKPIANIDECEDIYGASELKEGHLAEITSSAVDELCGFEVVPHTELFVCTPPSTSSQMKGSFQFYVENTTHMFNLFEDGEDFWNENYQGLQDRLNTDKVKAMVLKNFEELALLDLVTANNDGHFNNILAQAVENSLLQTSELKLIGIDRAGSFPWCHDKDLPPNRIRPAHWFRWRVLPHAQHPFSEEVVKGIEYLDVNKIENCMRKHLIDEDLPWTKLMIEGKVETFHQRMAEIQKLVKQGANIADIAIAILQLTSLPSSIKDSSDSLIQNEIPSITNPSIGKDTSDIEIIEEITSNSTYNSSSSKDSSDSEKKEETTSMNNSSSSKDSSDSEKKEETTSINNDFSFPEIEKKPIGTSIITQQVVTE